MNLLNEHPASTLLSMLATKAASKGSTYAHCACNEQRMCSPRIVLLLYTAQNETNSDHDMLGLASSSGTGGKILYFTVAMVTACFRGLHLTKGWNVQFFAKGQFSWPLNWTGLFKLAGKGQWGVPLCWLRQRAKCLSSSACLIKRHDFPHHLTDKADGSNATVNLSARQLVGW